MNRQGLIAVPQAVELADVVRLAQSAGEAIRSDFFHEREILQYRGKYDVQLRADVSAQRIIVDALGEAYPDHGVVAEEGLQTNWSSTDYLWVVDPLDGTNNFGYGIAHCAVVLTLFKGEDVVLAVVHDPLLRREFCGSRAHPFTGRTAPVSRLDRATVSLVTDYSQDGRQNGLRLHAVLNRHCKRVLSLWAPGVDLALVADGQLDAMVCGGASLLDVCGGLFLVESAGGCVLDWSGKPLTVSRKMHDQPVKFVASKSPVLAQGLLELVTVNG